MPVQSKHIFQDTVISLARGCSKNLPVLLRLQVTLLWSCWGHLPNQNWEAETIQEREEGQHTAVSSRPQLLHVRIVQIPWWPKSEDTFKVGSSAACVKIITITLRVQADEPVPHLNLHCNASPSLLHHTSLSLCLKLFPPRHGNYTFKKVLFEMSICIFESNLQERYCYLFSQMNKQRFKKSSPLAWARTHTLTYSHTHTCRRRGL